MESDPILNYFSKPTLCANQRWLLKACYCFFRDLYSISILFWRISFFSFLKVTVNPVRVGFRRWKENPSYHPTGTSAAKTMANTWSGIYNECFWIVHTFWFLWFCLDSSILTAIVSSLEEMVLFDISKVKALQVHSSFSMSTVLKPS